MHVIIGKIYNWKVATEIIFTGKLFFQNFLRKIKNVLYFRLYLILSVLILKTNNFFIIYNLHLTFINSFSVLFLIFNS